MSVIALPLAECEETIQGDNNRERQRLLDGVITYAIWFMDGMHKVVNRHGLDFPIPNALPDPSGRIQLEWERDGQVFRIIIDEPGSLYVVLSSAPGHLGTPTRMSVVDVARSLCRFLGAKIGDASHTADESSLSEDEAGYG